jgi:hypothetical protein
MVIEALERDPGRPAGTRPTTSRKVATAAILAALVVSALALYNVVESRHNRAPYAAAAVAASVRMEMVAPRQAQAVVDRLAGPGRLTAPFVEPVEGGATPQQVVGQLTFRTPANAPKDGQYALFVIDRAQSESVSSLYATGPAGTNVSQGWDGKYNDVAAKYPWLRMLADTRTPDGSSFTNSGMAAVFAPNTPGPVTFIATLDAESLPVTDPAQQLTVALVFIGADGQIYWATKLAG